MMTKHDWLMGLFFLGAVIACACAFALVGLLFG
jgi:hypothetical protein